jgi:hypothetical protein
MIGIGAGSKFQPIKAGVVSDDDDDEVEVKVAQLTKSPNPSIRDIVEELD